MSINTSILSTVNYAQILFSPSANSTVKSNILNNILKKQMDQYKALQQQESDALTSINDFSVILSNLSALQTSASNLANMDSGMLTTNFSDNTFASATPLEFGTSGNYTLQIRNIAAAQSVFSPVYAAKTSAVADLSTYATQKLSIQAGNGNATEITVDSSNNTLSGLSDSINAANAGVTTSVENSGFAINGANNTISFNDGSDRTATIATGTYTSSGLARAIKTALESANGGYDTYTVSYDSTANKFSIANDSTNINQITVNWAASTARNNLGFATTDQSTVAVGSSATSDTASLGTGYSLVLNSNSTGANNKIIVKADVNNDGVYSETGIEAAQSGLSALAFNAAYDSSGNVTGGLANMGQSQAAVDANFMVNGVAYTRANNNNTDVIQGTTLNLIKGDKYYSTTPETIQIGISPLMLRANLDTFASSFSRAMSAINSYANAAQTTTDTNGNTTTEVSSETTGSSVTDSYGTTTTITPGLGGDPVFQSLVQDINSFHNSEYITNKGIQSLSYLGLNFDAYGNITFDPTRLQMSITEDAASVTNIASQIGMSLSSKLDTYINNIIPNKQDDTTATYNDIKTSEQRMLNQVHAEQSIYQPAQSSADMIANMLANASAAPPVNSLADLMGNKG